MRELFYIAANASDEDVLWVSDTSGTEEIAATGVYGPALDPTSLVAVGDNVYFFAKDSFWKRRRRVVTQRMTSRARWLAGIRTLTSLRLVSRRISHGSALT